MGLKNSLFHEQLIKEVIMSSGFNTPNKALAFSLFGGKKCLSFNTQNRVLQGLFRKMLFLFSCLLLSCSDLTQQYRSVAPESSNPFSYSQPPQILTAPSHKEGGLLLFQKREKTDEEKKILIRENSLVPIKYKERSAGNISMETTFKESKDILHLSFSQNITSYYEEGISVAWRKESPRIPYNIRVYNSYQGAIDFGPWIGEDQRHAKMGQSFSNHFSSSGNKIEEDEKARHFITSLYKHFEQTEEDCLKSQKCLLSINPQGNYIIFQFPKMVIFFGNDERRNMVHMVFTRDDDPACLQRPFDLLFNSFDCNVEEEFLILDGSYELYESAGDFKEDRFLSLGDSYKSAVQKSVVNTTLSLTYGNNYLFQITNSGEVGWKRNNFEEKVKNIPENSVLSLVTFNQLYNLPLLLKKSLVKINLAPAGKIELELDPLPLGYLDPANGIQQKLEAIKNHPSEFYLSTNMPQIKNNYSLQKNLIRVWLNLMEREIKNLHPSEDMVFYKRVFNEYDDKHSLSAKGLLIVSAPGQSPLMYDMEIDEPSGQTTLSAVLLNDDFSRYGLKSQKSLNLDQASQKLNGFSLGDKIYLRDKKIGAGTAITAYIDDSSKSSLAEKDLSDEDSSKVLTVLASYWPEEESAVLYESGRDKNISFQKSEGIYSGGIWFDINPTGHKKEIEGKLFDEYEINGLSTNGESFFKSLNSLCSIKGFDVQMGLFDQTFAKDLMNQIFLAKNSSPAIRTDLVEDFPGCFYISPQDPLFSSLKRAYIFPQHNLVLSFRNRELFALRIYKKASSPQKQAKGGAQ